MGSRIDFGQLISEPNIILGEKYLSRLGGSNSVKVANALAWDILNTFSLETALFHQEKLASAGCNFGLSLIYAVNLPDKANRDEKLKSILGLSEKIDTTLYLNQKFGHQTFSESMKGLLGGYSLLYQFLKESNDPIDSVSEIAYVLSDMLSLVTLSSMKSSGTCLHIAKLLRNAIPRKNIDDFVLSFDPTSSDSLERKIESILGMVELDYDRLEPYREVEEQIWQAPFWELYSLYNKAIKTIQAATLKKISRRWNENCVPKVIECLAIRPDIRESLANLQSFLLA